jgi:hypothetical protein
MGFFAFISFLSFFFSRRSLISFQAFGATEVGGFITAGLAGRDLAGLAVSKASQESVRTDGAFFVFVLAFFCREAQGMGRVCFGLFLACLLGFACIGLSSLAVG